MKTNYDLFVKSIIKENEGKEKKPALLLHSCCAPCSSYVLEYLSSYFDITLFFYNPNISPEKEFTYRLEELTKFVKAAGYSIPIVHPNYDSSEFYNEVRGFEEIPEGGERCRKCYTLRLRRAAEAANEGGFDFFTTTLSISPYKNAQWLNEIGAELEGEFGVKYLYSDFKKNNGYKRSIDLSREFNLYRQDYCGCAFSKAEAEKRRKTAE